MTLSLIIQGRKQNQNKKKCRRNRQTERVKARRAVNVEEESKEKNRQ